MRGKAAKFAPAFVGMLMTTGSAGAEDRADGEVDFAQEVSPILAEHCVECHGPEEDKSGLRLHTRDEALQTDYVIIPGEPEESELYFRVSQEADHPDLMPPEDQGGPLPEEQVRTIRR